MPKVSAQQQLNDFAQFLSYKPTWMWNKFMGLPPYYNQIAFFCGNQAGKTTILCHEKIMRAIGAHPVPEKNYLYFECANGHTYGRPAPWPGLHFFRLNDGECFSLSEDKRSSPKKTMFPKNMTCFCGEKLKIHERNTSIYRLCSENLPMEKEGSGADSAEIKNRTYPELKKWLPPFLIIKDISQRNPSLKIQDINSGCVFGEGPNAIQYKGKDIIFEFVSYSQVAQSTAGTQRLAIFADEEPPYTFYEEQMPRLTAENGDFQIGLTPAIRTSYTFDEFYEEAEIYVRTPAICAYYKSCGEDDKTKNVEKTSRKTFKAVFQSATDDNPTLTPEAIARTLNYPDEDTVATRRYGIHRQASGRILKDFDWKIHVIDSEKYFPTGRIPLYWTHFRGIDYHPKTPWACGCCSLSPTDEMFIWFAQGISPDKFTTFQIMEKYIYACQDYSFRLSLVDPLATANKRDTVTDLDEINRVTRELKLQNIGTGGYWQPWDTRGDYGRDQIKVRLKNSRRVGRPFNNEIIEDGRPKRLPTLWIFRDGALEAAESMSKWSWEQWADQTSMTTKDDKNTPQQKWSHLNMVWECLAKNPYFKFNKHQEQRERHYGEQYMKSSGGRR